MKKLVIFLFVSLFCLTVGAAETCPNDEIWYTSTYENVVTPNNTGVFGATIVSNTYSDGKGIIKFNGNVTSIGSGAFYNRYGLTSINIPDSVTSIGNYAFEYCYGLKSINIPNSVTSIGDAAFSGCSCLTSITIPNSVTYIGVSAFEYCSGIKEPIYNNKFFVKLPVNYSGEYKITEGIQVIYECACSGCSGLTSINIPNSVTSIGSVAFSGCSSLTSITIPNSVTYIGVGAFRGCTGLTSITIPNSVKSIVDRAFADCSSLTSIDIPNSVTSIGGEAFYYCSGLTSVTIPKSVTTIGGNSFANCTLLQEIYVNWETPISINSNVFEGVNKNRCTLHVPKGCVNKYIAAPVWTDFTNIKEYNPSGKDNFITISGVNGTILKQVIELGQKYSFILNNDKEGNVTLVKFNGEDVTSQVINGKYTTPLISANSEIYVEYDNSPLGDTNLDGSVDVTDITKTASIILNGKAKEDLEDSEETEE